MSIRRLISLHNKAEKKILVCMTLVIMLMMTAGFTRAGAPDMHIRYRSMSMDARLNSAQYTEIQKQYLNELA